MVAGAFLRSLAWLAVTAASGAMFLQLMRSKWLVPFVGSNSLSPSERVRLIAVMAAAACVASLAGAIHGWRCGAPRLRRLAHALVPLALLGPLLALCVPEAWPSALNAVIAIAAVVLLAERALRLSLAAWAEAIDAPVFDYLLVGRSGLGAYAVQRARHIIPLVVVLAAASAYALYMSIQTLWMHGRFQTYGYDLGQYDSVFWSTLHGHPFRDGPLGRLDDWSELGNHADLSTIFFLPFYAVKPGAPALLVIQSCVLGLGSIPIFRFASRRLSRATACVVAIIYLFYPPLHGLQFYDFHFQPIASTFVLFVIDFVDARRYWLCALAFVVAVGCREDVSIGLAILGIFLLMSGYRVRAGLLIAVASAGYFFAMRFVIMPKFGNTWFHDIYKDLLPDGVHGFAGVIATLLSNPAFVFTSLLTADKLRYALQILVPLAFLPLRRAYLATSLVHGSLLTLLTTQYAPTIDIGFQYSANFIPYVFAAVVLALEASGRDDSGAVKRRAALGAMVVGTALCSLFWGAVPPRKGLKGGFVTMAMVRPSEQDRRKEKDLAELAALVPESAWLAVSEQELPHVSRLNMKSLRDTIDADYFLYGTQSGFFGSTNGDRLLAAGLFEKIGERPGLVLSRRKDLAPRDPRDLAEHSRWHASSALVHFEQTGVGQHWPEAGHGAFFHTLDEESPWIELDLGAPTSLQGFTVTNRLDCCQDRAFPLVAETSTDEIAWTEVAKQVSPLDTWSQDLGGRVARFVRFRALRKTLLHFASVQLR